MTDMKQTPSDYDAWYETERGRWIGDAEFHLLWRVMEPERGATILDVGCGTGYFTRRFAGEGLIATGVDIDPSRVAYAKTRDAKSAYIMASADGLPFPDKSFDYCASVTSLCFVKNPKDAVAEMMRVSRKGVTLGLLNRRSLLYWLKHGKGAYAGARWNTAFEALSWTEPFRRKIKTGTRYAIFLPSGSKLARFAETILPSSLPLGGFAALHIKQTPQA